MAEDAISDVPAVRRPQGPLSRSKRLQATSVPNLDAGMAGIKAGITAGIRSLKPGSGSLGHKARTLQREGAKIVRNYAVRPLNWL